MSVQENGSKLGRKAGYIGKEKCKLLKQIRRRIAEENGIPCTEKDCTHTGECQGTCPYCEAELKKLEEALKQRASRGRRVAVAGLAVGMMATAVSCDSPFSSQHVLEGDMQVSTDTTEQVTSTEIPGKLLAEETTTEPLETEAMGELSLETLMGDFPYIPGVNGTTAGVPPVSAPLPEPEEGPVDPTVEEAVTTNLPSEETVLPVIAGRIGPAETFLPEPDDAP